MMMVAKCMCVGVGVLSVFLCANVFFYIYIVLFFVFFFYQLFYKMYVWGSGGVGGWCKYGIKTALFSGCSIYQFWFIIRRTSVGNNSVI